MEGENRPVFRHVKAFGDGPLHLALTDQLALIVGDELLGDQRLIEVRRGVIATQAAELHQLDVVYIGVVSNHNRRLLGRLFFRGRRF